MSSGVRPDRSAVEPDGDRVGHDAHVAPASEIADARRARDEPDVVAEVRSWLTELTGRPFDPEPGGPPTVAAGSPSTGPGGARWTDPQPGALGSDDPGSDDTAPDGLGSEDVGSDRRPGGRRSGNARSGGLGSTTSGGRGRRRRSSGDPAEDPDADPETVARTIALRKLAAQARTRHELDQALRKKDVPPDVAAAVLDRFEDVGLVDDETFAHDWVASRQQRRHLSRSALRRELQNKGVDREVVDDAVATVDLDDELVAARALAVKKARTMGGLDPHVRRRRLAGALARRGFGGGVVSAVLGELGDAAETDA